MAHMAAGKVGTGARAGEGGGLPKGLSLFRFVLFSSLMLGACYGGASLYFNAPPMPGDIPPHGTPAAQWSPQPLWLPSYLALQFSPGVIHAPEGYVFTRLGHAAYGSLSIILGIALFGVFGWWIGETIRRIAVKRRYAVMEG